MILPVSGLRSGAPGIDGQQRDRDEHGERRRAARSAARASRPRRDLGRLVGLVRASSPASAGSYVPSRVSTSLAVMNVSTNVTKIVEPIPK